ncbi:probable hexosyltransferase MUCI70 isoform X2 [Oryza glaberrima]|nr:probable hexosyltransferase MUCI70 isoform X2 [Oryza glaberrima]
MPERRLPISTPAAAGPRRHPRRQRRHCRLLVLPAFALALVSLAYLSFSSHPNLPFHEKHHDMASIKDVKERMDQRQTLDAKVKANLSMTKVESEPFKRRKKSRKHYVPCQIEFLPSVDDLVEPGIYNNFTGFSLNYISKENVSSSNGIFEPLFGGHQSLQEREETYYARNQTLHCGFVQGPEDYPNTGFDLDENDKIYMASCHVVVSSCIFGSSDYLRRPTKSKIGPYSKKNVCFVMFLDELTLGTLSSEGTGPDETGFIGLWRIVVVEKLPYKDMRRAGKVPKFLAHRLFPFAMYSIWLDSKLRLNADPMLIVEYFLWRNKAEYAISVHYDRTCVSEEVLQNKRLNKYNHTAIDEQFYFYQSDGLVKFNESGREPVLPSYVPEGSFIVRAHTPMSNLFSCLWFNEVNRFTSRDQLSFAYTYLKLRRMNTGKPFHLNMFKDCERRAITKLFHHRANETADPPPANP